MVESLGFFSFVLHGHIPYVLGHGDWPHGAVWLYEASAETYVPVLNVLHELIEEGLCPRLTIGLTPILCEQLRKSEFEAGFLNYLDERVKASTQDLDQFKSENRQHLAHLANRWLNYYTSVKESYQEQYQNDIVGAYKTLQDKNVIEIITSAATHAYFPLLGRDSSINAQIKIGLEAYKKHFKREPQGFWLPECAYRPAYRWKAPIGDYPEIDREGIENLLLKNQIQYFLVDSHLITGAEAIGVYIDRFKALKTVWDHFESQYEPMPKDFKGTPYEPYIASGKATEGAVFFSRDPKTGTLVWSGEYGYPAIEGRYLDFHKKHLPGGNKYWAVTSPKTPLGDKQEYQPGVIPRLLDESAGHFKKTIKNVLQKYKEASKKTGIVVAPFDFELFGHWWFEGPGFLQRVLKWIETDPEIELTTCGRYLQQNKPSQAVRLPEGSWGQGGHHYIWFNKETAWCWNYIYECEQIMEELAIKHKTTSDSNTHRILKQLARELLLLESSDWEFLISTWSARDYAENRVVSHYDRFKRIYQLFQKYEREKTLSEGDWLYIKNLEMQDDFFPNLKVEWFAEFTPKENT
ncbi:MAG: 1,4-alpha-glucan branching protein domain-containing protein [Promethearchaeota archaeon]